MCTNADSVRFFKHGHEKTEKDRKSHFVDFGFESKAHTLTTIDTHIYIRILIDIHESE